MIAHLRGKLLAKTPQSVIVEAAGVGYEVAISIPTYTGLPGEGAEISLHIYTHVREESLALFGFADPAEKRLFEKLFSVSGIGPKLALTVLSGLSPERLVAAIRSQDHAMLTRIPGIGKKTAERVVLELKDKLEEMGPTVIAGAAAPVAEDVISALVNLGYQRPAALKALETALARSPESKNNFEHLFRATMAALR
ncbi:MAG TPA: Holliday junction branch migration protein RuvA [Acidobacteriaceae bacterium]|nr:Holliday junction branch migration protein RuvA [Acidobacteriaceae bacterium]